MDFFFDTVKKTTIVLWFTARGWESCRMYQNDLSSPTKRILAIPIGKAVTQLWTLFYYQLIHTTLKNAELLKHSKLDKTLQHVSVYIETIFRELKSVLG